MFFAILLYPLISAICCGFFGWALGYYGVCLLGIFCIGISFIYSIFLFNQIALTGDVLTLELWPWFDTGSLNLSWGFLYDSITGIMFLVVTFISLLVHIYSTGYMKNDPHFARFICYLSLFTFFMLILVSADNFIQLFLGWEGVGLCSYLLISFWYTRIQANKAAIKALIVNRIGDFAIIIALSLLFLLYKSLKYAVIFCITPHIHFLTLFTLGQVNYPLITVICFFLFLGAVGKSAQIGLHTWLPDAMEGPTPVSALIHAATMVTAGVFLIIRCSPLFEYAPMILTLLLFFGAFTCFFASTVGLVQHDIKKIIAYSTCSQLGYMIFVCGFSNYNLSLYHLTTHACFKALLFLCAGSVIHAVLDEQDLRRLGGLRQLLPLTYVCMLIGSLALIGFPFLAGFYSKDLIIESAAGSVILGSTFVYWLSSISAILTSIYSTRLLFYTFFDQPNGSKQIFSQIHESSWAMLFPLILLSLFSIFVGYLGQDLFAGLGTHFFGNAIFILPQAFQVLEVEFLPWYIKIIPICFSLVGFGVTLFMYFVEISFLYHLKLFGFKLFYFLSKKWYFDVVYNKIVVYPIFHYSFFGIYTKLDKGFLEKFGPMGLNVLLSQFARYCRHLHTTVLYQYLCFMLLAIFLFIGFFF